jgi:hypothetical protein
VLWWEAFYYLIGDARKTLEAFAQLLKGSTPARKVGQKSAAIKEKSRLSLKSET